MADIHIPPEAEMALANEVRRQCGIAISPLAAAAAIRAALAAWPGVKTKLANSINVEPREQHLILPLTEPRDD